MLLTRLASVRYNTGICRRVSDRYRGRGRSACPGIARFDSPAVKKFESKIISEENQKVKNYIFTPGPVAVPSEVLIEMAKPIMHHRTKEFEAIFAEVREGLKYIYDTKQEVFVLAASGTGAMEAAVVNTLSRGDKVLVVNGGKFGERWGKICKAFGLDTQELMVEWGHSVDPADIEKALEKDPSIRAVLVQASETSTGVMHPTKEIADITRHRDDVILIVDGITGVGVFPLPFDEIGIDVMVGGSQKAFMLPPGLSFAAMSEKAWKFNKIRTSRNIISISKPHRKTRKNTTPYAGRNPDYRACRRAEEIQGRGKGQHVQTSCQALPRHEGRDEGDRARYIREGRPEPRAHYGDRPAGNRLIQGYQGAQQRIRHNSRRRSGPGQGSDIQSFTHRRYRQDGYVVLHIGHRERAP
jgi:aspartate aminotransferase-like enzyme